MRAINAALVRLAHIKAPNASFRVLFANLAKIASVSQDMWCRASFLEGALGRKPMSLSSEPKPFFDMLRDQIARQDGSMYTELVFNKGFTDRQLLSLVSERDEGVFRALRSGIQKAMHPYETLRSVDAEGAATAISFGISPVTHRKLKKFGGRPGEGLFYYYGKRSKGNSVRQLISLAKKAGVREGIDLKKTALSQHEQSQVYLDTPVDDADGDAYDTLLDLLQGGGGITEFPGWSTGLAGTLMTQQSVLDVLSPMVSAGLKTPTQVAVWEVLKENPGILDAKGTREGGLEMTVKARELAKGVAAALEKDYTGKSMDVVVRKVFNTKILPAMYDALKTDEAAKEFVRSRDIREVMLAEMRRRKKSPGGRTRGIGIKGIPKTPGRGPKEWQVLEGDAFKRERDVQMLSEYGRQSERMAPRLPRFLRRASERKQRLRLARLLREEGLLRVSAQKKKIPAVIEEEPSAMNGFTWKIATPGHYPGVVYLSARGLAAKPKPGQTVGDRGFVRYTRLGSGYFDYIWLSE